LKNIRFPTRETIAVLGCMLLVVGFIAFLLSPFPTLILSAISNCSTYSPLITGASGATAAWPPGYQAARDDLVAFKSNSTTNQAANHNTSLIGNNQSGRVYFVTHFSAASNYSTVLAYLETCSNYTNSTCNTNWTTVNMYYVSNASAIVVDYMSSPIRVAYNSGFHVRFPSAVGNDTAVITTVGYLNMPP